MSYPDRTALSANIEELSNYYSRWHGDRLDGITDSEKAARLAVLSAMDEFARSEPDCHPSLLKARLHEEMAERFEPVIFRHTPFFWEMGMRFAENWGVPDTSERVVGSWLFNKRRHLVEDRTEQRNMAACRIWNPDSSIGWWMICGGFDLDHHCLGYTKLLNIGINGVLREIEKRRSLPCDDHQRANLEAMARSCRAVIRVAERFGLQARSMLEVEKDDKARTFLQMIADTAGHIPANPPRTFHEGLTMLWFLREVTASLEAIGISVVGHPDRQLWRLYKDDIESGRLTEEQARDLLARWMLPTDIKFHVDDGRWPETSTCMELGGCDEDGNVVWNDLTRLIIEVHHDLGLMNPKLNCRIASDSPAEYLDLISSSILAGHNCFAALNDDVLIRAFVDSGKTEREARLYVNGGCQEPIVEGVEHSAGAAYYLSMPRVLDLCLRHLDEPRAGLPEDVVGLIPEVIENPGDFEDFYARFTGALIKVIETGADWIVALGRDYWKVHPCPFFSTTLAGCIENAIDYTQGGAKYNPSCIALVGLATVVDSLQAVRDAVFNRGWISLDDMRQALADDWKGHEELRQRIMHLPRFGQGEPDVDALAARFADDLAKKIRSMPSERGGRLQPSFFVYYANEWFAPHVRALPNGRRSGEILTQGISPDRTTPDLCLTEVFLSLTRIDYRKFPGNAVLDVQLPTGDAMPVGALSATIRTFAKLGGPTLQLNCVSLDDMRDAQAHPERHQDLIVRICGLSARFVSLDKSLQDEIIGRWTSHSM